VSGTLTDTRRLCILAILHDLTCECLGLSTDTSPSGMRLTRELDTIIARRSQPISIVSDSGTELTSMAILRWRQETGIKWHYIAPGKPTQNALVNLARFIVRLLQETDSTQFWRKFRGSGQEREIASEKYAVLSRLEGAPAIGAIAFKQTAQGKLHLTPPHTQLSGSGELRI
jgi:putative transposase